MPTVNIIVYFIILLAIFVCFIDRILKTNYLKIGFGLFVIIAVIFIPDFSKFSTELFNKSVGFLNWFDVVGMNYIEASVIICVIIPIIIIFVLFKLSKRKKIIE